MEKWIDRVRAFKKEQILVLLLCGVLLLVIALPTGEPEVQTQTQTEPRAEEQNEELSAASLSDAYVRRLEQRLKSILAQVEGIGKTEVMLTVKSDGRKLIEKDLEQSQGKEENQGEEASAVSDQASSSESTVYQRDAQGNEFPYVTEELEPEIAGVLVIAQGAGDATVVAEITDAVKALFGVEAHKIKVMKME